MTDDVLNPYTEPADELALRIRSRMETLSPAEARVAAAVLREPNLVASSTLMSLKNHLGVSEATIVRAARSLGFDGYPQLRLSMAAAAGQRRTTAAADVVTGDISLTDSTADTVAKLAGAEQRALRQTAAGLDAAVLDRVADALASAGRILTFGVGASGLVALDLQEKLSRAGFVAMSPAGTELGLTSAALLGPSDVAILVSHRGRSTDTLDVLEAAERSGARTVAITSFGASPLAQRSADVLTSAGHDMEFRPAALASRMGQLFVIDCLFVVLSQRTWPRTSAALGLTRAAIDARRGTSRS